MTVYLEVPSFFICVVTNAIKMVDNETVYFYVQDKNIVNFVQDHEKCSAISLSEEHYPAICGNDTMTKPALNRTYILQITKPYFSDEGRCFCQLKRMEMKSNIMNLTLKLPGEFSTVNPCNIFLKLDGVAKRNINMYVHIYIHI